MNQSNYDNQDRVDFEFQAVKSWGEQVDLRRHPDGDYCNSIVRHRWHGWLAMKEFSKTMHPPAYEIGFQQATTQLVMSHIDRMNDICPEDTADQIVASFTSKFAPILDSYSEMKFPGREAQLRNRTE